MASSPETEEFMKVTLKTIILAIPALSKMSGEDLSLRLAYRLRKK